MNTQANPSYKVSEVVMKSWGVYLGSPTGYIIERRENILDSNNVIIVCSARNLSEKVKLWGVELPIKRKHKLFGILWLDNPEVRATQTNWVFEVCGNKNVKAANIYIPQLVKESRHNGGIWIRPYEHRCSPEVAFLKNFQPF